MRMSAFYHIDELLAGADIRAGLEGGIEHTIATMGEEAAQEMATFVKEPSAKSLLALEQNLIRRSLQMCSQIVAIALYAVHQDTLWVREQVRQVQHHAEGKSYRQMGQRSTRVRLLDGCCIQLMSPYLAAIYKGPGRPRGVGRRGKGGAGSFPVLESLGIHHQATPGLLSEVAKASTRQASFEEARVTLAEQGCVLDEKTVQRLAMAVGAQALEQRDARILAAEQGERESDEFVGKRVVIGTDGGRLRTRVPKRGRRRSSGRRGFDTPWREPKLLMAYVVDEEGCLEKNAIPLYDATLGNADETFAILLAELKLRGASEALELCVVGDGARWIWQRVDELAEGLGLAKEQVVRVADFYHVSQRLSEISQLPKGWSAEERKQWYGKMRSLLWKGRISEVLRACRRLQKGRRSKALKEHLNYLQKLRDYMQYDVYRKQGWPCGSGAVESAIRRVVNLRLKGPGMFWSEDNAQAMLHLRSYLKAGRWNELMMRVLNRSFNGKSRFSPRLPAESLPHAA